MRVDIDAYKDRLLTLTREFRDEFLQLPSYEDNLKAGFGVGYNKVDAYVLYAMIRSLKPARYIEIGSGISTLYSSLAGTRNAPTQPLEITCIEPNPYLNLHNIPNSKIIAKQVQDVELSLFEQLSSGDVLFVDSSHIVRIDGDVPYIYLEILPSLKQGVVIHIHDIPFPYNVPHPPKQWVFAEEPDSLFWPVFWNEAMMLQALLCGHPEFEILLSLPLIRYHDETFIRETVPNYEDIQDNPKTFSSIWIRKCG
jgi:predicted O-methyltransferase YrrM